jgi:queuine tRNA-ribosyltransferase
VTSSVLSTRRGDVSLPQFVPDATRAVVRGVPSGALVRSGVQTILVSTAHLAIQPGTSVVRALGGVHRFTSWSGPVISDSGGFQAFSLLTGQKGLATVSDAGLSYRFSPKQRFRDLTPKSCIEIQLSLGADVVYCLDYCTHPLAPDAEQEKSVSLTIRWAAECRGVFDRLVADTPPEQRPKLFAVVQGGQRADLRKRCADALMDLAFDGYGFGGYPIAEGQLVDEVELTATLLPADAVLHGLGIGTPESLVAAWRCGYSIFDCTLPTRNARRGVLYTDLDTGSLAAARRVSRIARMSDEKWVRATGPVDADCDCELCAHYSAAYLAHLFRVEDSLAHTLASVHNLRFYTRLATALREQKAPADGAPA